MTTFALMIASERTTLHAIRGTVVSRREPDRDEITRRWGVQGAAATLREEKVAERRSKLKCCAVGRWLIVRRDNRLDDEITRRAGERANKSDLVVGLIAPDARTLPCWLPPIHSPV